MSHHDTGGKPTLDKDLDKFTYVEEATSFLSRSLVAPGLGVIFVAVAIVFAGTFVVGENGALLVMAAAAIGAYMALNIGANDVANNVGPAVGANALSMTGALLLAAACESAGALIAGGDVVATISEGIVAPASIGDGTTFVWAMMAALLAAALWINLATWLSAPVSTTHAIVGGVIGAGALAAGPTAVNWSIVGAIAASWIAAPVLGGLVAAGLLAFINATIVYQDDKIAAARRWVPALIALMVGAFTAYLAVKGLGRLVAVDLPRALGIGLVFAAAGWLLAHPMIGRQSAGLENRNQSLRVLFTWPLVLSAALLSFAHGANDVANAIGPLAAIVGIVQAGSVGETVAVPGWVMVIGAFGISVGLMLFGPRIIRMVGRRITKLNPMRAFCVALSAAITVLIASALGMPVSSTHIAVGGVFGVGFFREWHTARSQRRAAYLERRRVLLGTTPPAAPAEELRRRRLVRRSHVMTILAAWLVTVPIAAAIGAGLFALLRSVFL